VAWQCSVEEGAGLATPRASLRHCGSLGPTHGDGGVVRWLGDGEPQRKQRMVSGGAYQREKCGGKGVGQVAQHPYL
jgi:hypothetical protein